MICVNDIVIVFAATRLLRLLNVAFLDNSSILELCYVSRNTMDVH